MFLGGVGWDRKEFPESNLHMYSKDDTKIVLCSMEKCTKRKKKKSSNLKQEENKLL